MKKSKLYSLIEIILFPFYFAYLCIFKDKNIWVFGSWKGKKYADNSKALFEFVSGKQGIKAIWLTKNSKVYNNLIKNGYECYKFNSLKGIYFCLIAKVVVLSVSYFDVSPFTYLCPWKLKIIQLWHGTPLKTLDMKCLSKKEIFFTKLFKIFLNRSMDLLFSATNLNKKIYSELFEIKEDKIIITGQPRNDLMFAKRYEEKSSKHKQKIILYLPTWREYNLDYDLFFQHGFDMLSMNEFLKRIDAKLLIKFHVNESARTMISGDMGNTRRIEFLSIDDIYEILGKIDILITDYSSIYFDFLLLNRPIIFTPFDLNVYEEERGFYYDYEKVTPGPKACNWVDVMAYIEKVILKDKYRDRRMAINKDFNFWQDGNSTKRVYKEIINIIDKK